MTWFNAADPTADAQAARGLLDQQEYEFQRALADMQLAIRQLGDLVDRRQPTPEATQLLGDLGRVSKS